VPKVPGATPWLHMHSRHPGRPLAEPRPRRGRAGEPPTCEACRRDSPEIERSDSSPRLRSAWH